MGSFAVAERAIHRGSAVTAAADSTQEREASLNFEDATFALHTAFEDPSTPPDAPPRESIEVRCVVIV